MADNSKIEWCDATWNVVTGCDRISSGCDHCYIDRSPPFRMEGRRFDEHGKMGVRLHPDRLDQPLRWRKPRRVFVNSLSDLFHKDIPNEFLIDVFAVMALAPAHTFQVLTKRSQRMAALVGDPQFKEAVWDRMWAIVEDRDSVLSTQERANHRRRVNAWLPPTQWPLPNVWLGVSVESQQYANLRIPHLLRTPAKVRFLSCEPLLGPVSLDQWISEPDRPLPAGAVRGPAIGWVIVGGESGPQARPMNPDWARRLRDECVSAGIPYFHKQWGEWCPVDRRLSGAQRFTQLDDGKLMFWTGKKRAGRELDGRTWDEFPKT